MTEQDVLAKYKAGIATRDEIIDHWKAQGYTLESFFPGEYIALQDPKTINFVRIYEDGLVWVKDPATGQYSKWGE